MWAWVSHGDKVGRKIPGHSPSSLIESRWLVVVEGGGQNVIMKASLDVFNMPIYQIFGFHQAKQWLYENPLL